MRLRTLALAGLPGPEAMGLPAAIAVLFVMDAGLPIPLPTDLLLLLIGERAAAGAYPLLAAAAALELVAVAGTAALFIAAKGPAGLVIARVGPRFGLTAARLESAGRRLERGGPLPLALGRATPGLRTATVLAAASAQLRPARALPPLIVGSTVFLQAHLLLGYWLGPAAGQLLAGSGLRLLLATLVLMGLGALVWALRRGRGRGAQAWTEACCPACLAVAVIDRRREIS